jgi:hypothetical protein
MKLIIKLTVIALGITLCSCGAKKKEDATESTAKEQQAGKTYDTVSEDFIANLREMSDILAKVDDLDSARSALPALTKIGFKMKMNETDREKLGPVTKEIAARIKKVYSPKKQAIIGEIDQTMKDLKISDPEAYRMINNVMKTIMQ